jgi:apolipoprotein N-acyltransferase
MVPAQIVPVVVPPVLVPEVNETRNTQDAPVNNEYPVSGNNQAPMAGAPAYPWGHVSYTQAPQKPVSKPATVAPAPVKPIPTLVTATHSLGTVCTTGAGPTKLWALLLVLYAAFVALLASMRKKAGESELDWSIPLTVLSFLGLLFFWYLSAVCRTGAWAPIVATIIACAGLIVMTFEEEQDNILLLEDTKKDK